MERDNKRWLSWAFVGLLAVLCAILAIVQNHWIHQVSIAERDRLRGSLEAGLSNISRDFSDDVSRAFAALRPRGSEIEEMGREAAYSTRYARWQASNGR